jgi:hypothetical protein
MPSAGRPGSVTTCGVLAGVVLLLATLTAQSRQTTSRAKGTVAHAALGLFTHSDNCLSCHNHLTTPAGDDVSIGTAWRSTIMANAARDPYFYASVRRETLEYPTRSRDIQDECAACHVPVAQKAAHSLGRLATVLSDSANPTSDSDDRLARDGVSCTVCHQIARDDLGSASSFNGNFRLAPTRPDGVRDLYGPFAVSKGLRTIMRSATGFEQVAAPHVQQSELCATCHTLITTALDRDGRVIGSLPEQMSYQEWRHSAFYDEGKSCQSCHMPRATGPLRVSSVLGEERAGLSRHGFLGGNAFMLRMLSRFRERLGVEAPSTELEATAQLTEQQLRRDTALLEISTPRLTSDAIEFDVAVRNLTGHKFPTGYPSRRAWLHVRVIAPDGQPLFESGALTSTGAIVNNENDVDAHAFEPHHDVIDRAGQVQIYESILGDAASRPTTGLLAAVRFLKDNRLLPRGYDKATADAEIGVFGAAREDATFSGDGDRVRYRINLEPGQRWTRIEVELKYQPIGYRWAHNLGNYGSNETSAFLQFFRAMERNTAATVASSVLSN